MKISLDIEKEFFSNMNSVFKEFCNRYPKLNFKHKTLSHEKMLNKLEGQKTVFTSAYYSYLEPSHNLTYLELLNIAYTLYSRDIDDDHTFITYKDSFEWIKVNDALKLITIFEEMSYRWETIDEIYTFIENNDFYFLKQDNNIFFGFGLEKNKSIDNTNLFLIIEENEKPDIFFKTFIDSLFSKTNISTTIQYKEKVENTIIKSFDNGSYWSYISDNKELLRLGAIHKNVLQDEVFVAEYNNDMEIYYLFNKEKEPLMFASFKRENDEPDAISTGETEKINKVFEPYVDYILSYKEQYDFTVEYDKGHLH
jgi:hypothetical protein